MRSLSDLHMHWKCTLLFLFSGLSSIGIYGQSAIPVPGGSHTDSWYIYWGWNREVYTRSDIHFQGADYDFTLQDVRAIDRQTKFSVNPYLNPVKMTIPQYNFRLGYYLNDHWNVSLGIDHMKYVMVQRQVVTMNGWIGGDHTYTGTYDERSQRLNKDFLVFEHTDGLNDLNLELRYSSVLGEWPQVTLRHTEGGGVGVLIPRTNTTLLGMERYDEFHLAGWALQVMAGLQLTFFERFLIQSEVKTGLIDMPDIRTTSSVLDKASQHFLFLQGNLVFGVAFGR